MKTIKRHLDPRSYQTSRDTRNSRFKIHIFHEDGITFSYFGRHDFFPWHYKYFEIEYDATPNRFGSHRVKYLKECLHPDSFVLSGAYRQLIKDYMLTDSKIYSMLSNGVKFRDRDEYTNDIDVCRRANPQDLDLLNDLNNLNFVLMNMGYEIKESKVRINNGATVDMRMYLYLDGRIKIGEHGVICYPARNKEGHLYIKHNGDFLTLLNYEKS